MHYGFPLRLYSEHGKNFVSSTIKNLCNLAGIKKSCTTPYHAMGNGQREWFNLTLLNMLGTLTPTDKLNWKKHMSNLTHAYNCTRHDSTGYSPFFLMFGIQPRLPIDVILGVDTLQSHGKGFTKYIEDLPDSLEAAYRIVHS